MKTKIIYCCESCNSQFDTKREAEEHEAITHYNLSYDEYCEWKTLNKTASKAGKMVSICKNPKTVAEFDAAIEKLCDFETYHGLQYVKTPDNFLY